jgi:hypothetical protein
MAYGGVAKKPLRKANNGTTVGSTTPAPAATPAKPRDPRMTVSSGASAPQPYNVNTPTYGGKPLTQAEADALNKKARMDRAMGRMQTGGTTVKARKTITGGTKVKTNNGEKVTVTRRNKAGNITKQSVRKAVKGWSEDEYKTGGATKAKRFAALAPPYDKATAADRIAGAKKNARKK